MFLSTEELQSCSDASDVLFLSQTPLCHCPGVILNIDSQKRENSSSDREHVLNKMVGGEEKWGNTRNGVYSENWKGPKKDSLAWHGPTCGRDSDQSLALGFLGPHTWPRLQQNAEFPIDSPSLHLGHPECCHPILLNIWNVLNLNSLWAVVQQAGCGVSRPLKAPPSTSSHCDL